MWPLTLNWPADKNKAAIKDLNQRSAEAIYSFHFFSDSVINNVVSDAWTLSISMVTVLN